MKKSVFLFWPVIFVALLIQAPLVQAQHAMPVVAEDVTVQDVEAVYRTLGRILAQRDAIVTVEKSSRIKEAKIGDGERVKAGQTLFFLESAIEEASLAAAKADLDVRVKALERLKKLVKVKAAPAADIPAKEAEIVAAKVGVRVAELDFEKTIVRAPFAGVLGILETHAGDYVTPGEVLVIIHEMPPLRVAFELPQRDFEKVAVGQSLKITHSFGQKHTHSGVLKTINPTLDQETGSIRMIGAIDEADELRPGMVVEVRGIIETRRNVTMVPETALVPRPDGLIIFKIVDGKAKLVKVKTGVRRDGLVEIKGGLEAGDKVVVEGQFRLRDGAPVAAAKSS
ncbi:efflux RND transporter periplasmic adaptor subunit [Nisaea nitritireducens]|uniref:efflux RND transporter periplasmic adaptor subunit n=1 Tax=Nisaea nitritireducens TaxID=568392 RepID=UPI001866A358|nr:efflux RND transporter periplasmic adaptor subunit [Nisaea nitritireducens]